ncbi:uncharacterized protein PpBr36_11113 [Pyricularia pennisetigena]|uniref:uncharacterized protein n=1 Tax=Pyricularia pennisetigena TaxID=1578925 RepID=UPI0011501448|nr:uncharacterized protein PpBr36_11113 [Pyricularia pennisetigena]TLS20608.1 hypothetical protein PpBr36_11113 [Pyricularia pennisetigena]
MAAAREIFGFDDNKYLPLYHTPFKETTEITITTEGDGTPVQKKVIKRERNTVRFPDRVEEVYHLLSLIFDHQWDTGPDGVALKMRFSPRLRLEGFDFIDLAAYAEQIHPKFLELKATGKGWVDFVKAPTIFLSIFESKVAPPRLRSPDKLPEDGAVVFGRSGILKLYWPNAPEMTPTVDEQEE